MLAQIQPIYPCVRMAVNDEKNNTALSLRFVLDRDNFIPNEADCEWLQSEGNKLS